MGRPGIIHIDRNRLPDMEKQGTQREIHTQLSGYVVPDAFLPLK